MAAALVDKALLKSLIPANALNSENFQELAGKAVVEEFSAGKALFKQGEADKKSVYLLEGQVELVSDTGQKIEVVSGTESAKHPIGNQQPRKFTAVTKTPCKITRIDADLMDILLTWDQLSGIEVDEIADEGDEDDDGGDWMTRILQSKAFLQVPSANIQAMFMRMEEFPVKAGDIIIKQGDDGDYYYIIKNGKCKVTRANTKTGTELTLATLGDGDAFGEEALLTEAKRNANIVMATDGVLMRLSKQDFNELLREPNLKWVSSAEADKMVAEGAVWVDVRMDTEFKNNGIEGAINIPVFMLRLKADSLDPNKKYILYCDSGRRSSAAAYLLNERGLDAFCLKGGLVEKGG